MRFWDDFEDNKGKKRFVACFLPLLLSGIVLLLFVFTRDLVWKDALKFFLLFLPCSVVVYFICWRLDI